MPYTELEKANRESEMRGEQMMDLAHKLVREMERERELMATLRRIRDLTYNWENLDEDMYREHIVVIDRMVSKVLGE